MLMRIYIYFLLSACYMSIQSDISVATEPCDVQVAPNFVTIGATYNGGKVSVTGTVPSDAEVIIEVDGTEAETMLLKKKHVFGLFWMNSDTITVAGLPEVYMLNLPAKLPDNTLNALDMGFSALEQRATVIPETEDKAKELKEFFKLKKKEGLYTVHEDAVHYQAEDGAKSFTCELLIPAAMHQGTYTIKTLVVRNNKVFQTASNQLKVEETGLPAMIRLLAFNHAIIYGILATVIAIVAGLLIEFIFQSKQGVH
ncbi:MAG: hypothetical protein AUJ48_04650 [Deltaproteobacteria bacterium CG1_02_45_11]|nr:MAG: hypothetical protein AUJ48_04650 [Deltaproteobacteria bacterium CG1_02_45_11]